MKNIKKISDNDLGELADLIGRVQEQIHIYRHVSLPNSLTSEITLIEEKIEKELDRRERIMYDYKPLKTN